MKRNQNSQLYTIRMKYERAGVTDIDELNCEVERYLSTTSNPSKKSLDIIAGIYDFVAENIEREKYKHYSRDQWAELERQYVHRADYTLPDLVDDLLTLLEQGKITREQYREVRRSYKPCKHRFCLNYYEQRRKDHAFCCEDCRKREHDAINEYERTSKIYTAGTYLPPTAYKDTRQGEKEHAYRKHVRIFEPDIAVIIGDREQNNALERKDGNGKRNRKNEERRLRQWRVEKEAESYEKIVGIVQKGVQETTLSIRKGGQAH